MLKKYLIATLSPSPTAYFSMLKGEEAAFWAVKCQGSVWQLAWSYQPRARGIWYLSKLILCRMVLPYVIAGSALLIVICILVAAVLYCFAMYHGQI